MQERKCPACGTIHLELDEAAGQRYISSAMSASENSGLSPDQILEAYRKCHVCSAPSDEFVDAQSEDAPSGRSIPVVVRSTPAQPSAQGAVDLIRTELIVPSEMGPYAKKHGAIFDRVRARYFVIGEVPSELVNFLPRERREREHIQPPTCRCGLHTRLITNTKNGSWFYGCSNYPHCRQTVDYEKHLRNIGRSGDMSAVSALSKEPQPDRSKGEALVSETVKGGYPIDYQSEMADLVRVGVEVLGSQTQLLKWLSGRKVSLDGQAPTELVRTVEGCRKVKSLLLELRQ